MNDTEMWSLIAGFVSATFVLPVIQQPRWPSQVRALVTFAWCILVAVGTAYATGAFDAAADVRSWVTAFLGVFVGAITGYKGFAQPVGIAPAIERATSPGGSPGVHAAP